MSYELWFATVAPRVGGSWGVSVCVCRRRVALYPIPYLLLIPYPIP
jgi:hypothetical protein